MCDHLTPTGVGRMGFEMDIVERCTHSGLDEQ